ncbi:MAG: molybdopterin-dependent oxidoreductase, partial [Candidatus Mariimomonas ferrooxydans]
MATLTRRNFMKLGIASGALLTAGGIFTSSALAGTVKLQQGGKDFSPRTGAERKAIPSACWQCVTRCPNMGFVEDGRLVKLESNPNSKRTEGKMCAKGQAGLNHVYDPDRILYPMKRLGKRGEGQWKRISWDNALTELSGRLKKLRDDGHPEKFMFHYGRMKASSSKLIKSGFLAKYGTKTIGNHTSICEGGKWTAHELTWGKHYDNWDFDKTKFILNFGSNCQEAHTNHIPVSQRLIRAQVDRGVKMVTFDVRLSTTAAKSDEWIPIKPGTDGAVVLAMCNVVMKNGLYDRDFLKFVRATANVNASVDEKISALKSHLSKYTPEWAEKISGVSASKIKSLAMEFAKTKPAVMVSYRGAVAHYNGNDTERACQMLASITGNIDNPGGRCRGVGAGWKYPKVKDKPKAKKLKIIDGFPKGHKLHAAIPSHHMSHQVLKMIKDGKAGRPEIYMWYCYAPVYANGEIQENIDILKNESLIPYTVCSNPFYDESAALADLILPDATYLERWDWEDMVSPTQVGEHILRQSFVKPLGEARDLGDVVIDLADRMGMPLGIGSSKEEFVKKSCEKTAKKIQGFPGFDYMKKHGVWTDPKAKPKYYGYKKAVLDVSKEPVTVGGVQHADMSEPEKVSPHMGDDVLYDKETGVFWHWKHSKAKDAEEAMKKGYTNTKNAYKGYVGQLIGDKVYKGFKPDKLNKSGYFELYSMLLKNKGFAPLPTYVPIPEHQKMKSDDLILTTYKIAVHIHSRSQNCKWLSEMYHDNPGWINPKTAAARGIKNGDKIKVKSYIGEITTKARVTEKIMPGVIAISHSVGHWEYGRYASGKKAPFGHDNDPDLKLMWWKNHGVHANWIIPNSPDPPHYLNHHS